MVLYVYGEEANDCCAEEYVSMAKPEKALELQASSTSNRLKQLNHCEVFETLNSRLPPTKVCVLKPGVIKGVQAFDK